MANEPASQRPNGGDRIPLREYVTLWIGALERFYEERDRRYEERFKAQETAMSTALTAQKEATTTAFITSEKAIEKAESAQKAYDMGHNDLLRKMDDQYGLMMPRQEMAARLSRQDEDIRTLREDRGLYMRRSELIPIAVAFITVGGLIGAAVIRLLGSGG